MKTICLFILFAFIYGCQDFAFEKHIVREYYLIGVDSEDHLSISRKLNNENGSAIGRIQNVKEYAVFKDSLIFAKSEESKYFILNMKNDDDFVDPAQVVVGPLDLSSFNEYIGNNEEVHWVSAK